MRKGRTFLLQVIAWFEDTSDYRVVAVVCERQFEAGVFLRKWGSVAQQGGDVAAWVAQILSRFGSGRIFGDYCSPN